MQTDLEPTLAPPGAGLPTLELLLGRMKFALRRRRGDRESFNAHFQREREAIRNLVAACEAESGSRRILIPRLRGMEDSSRHWSIWMTLDHLSIVNGGITRIINSLAKGVPPPGASSTAAVKPSPNADASVAKAYEDSCDAFLKSIGAIPDLKTSAKYRHPWFGTLDASGWHALAGGHMGIHRVQIERILAGLLG